MRWRLVLRDSRVTPAHPDSWKADPICYWTTAYLKRQKHTAAAERMRRRAPYGLNRFTRAARRLPT